MSNILCAEVSKCHIWSLKLWHMYTFELKRLLVRVFPQVGIKTETSMPRIVVLHQVIGAYLSSCSQLG